MQEIKKINLSLEFDYYSLGDLVKIKYGKNQKKVQDDDNGKYPIYGTGGLMGYSIEYLYDKPSVLIGRKGSIEKVRYIDEPFWTVDTLFYTEVNEEMVIPRFLYYIMSQINLGRYNEGTSIPSLRTETLNRLDLPIPDLDYQNRVLSILSSIDKKIEINEKINKNLEELMHVLFKKYFIDNNPFYVENDEKWNIIKLKDLIIRNRDKINDFDNWKDELLIDLSNMPRFSIAISNFDKGKKFTSNIYKLNKYDLLFGSIRPYFGKVGFSPINGVVTGTVHSFKPIDDIYYSLVLSLISSKTFINYTVSVSKGTKMPSVKWDDFINYEFAIPDDLSKIGEYNKILLPLIHKIEKNILEIQRLTKLRDTLLPKLMSGEIDVSKINCDLELRYNYMKYLFNQIHTPMSKSVV